MRSGLVTAAIAALASPILASQALAHPGPHDDLSAARLFEHLFTDGFHVAQLGLVLIASFAGLGAWRLVCAARGAKRR
jgi:hypothetical protein